MSVQMEELAITMVQHNQNKLIQWTSHPRGKTVGHSVFLAWQKNPEY